MAKYLDYTGLSYLWGKIKGAFSAKGCAAISENGNTATTNIAAGKYVIWKDALYTANSAIASGAALSAGSGGNLTAVPDGGLNALNGRFSKTLLWENSYSDHIGDSSITLSSGSYEYLIVEWKITNGAKDACLVSKFKKGTDILLQFVSMATTESDLANSFYCSRYLKHTTDTQFTVGDGILRRMNGGFVSADWCAYPLRIYGTNE